MPLFSDEFSLSKTQAELDFVNIPMETDIPLFIDPFAISRRVNRWSECCHRTIITFFEQVIDAIRTGNDTLARNLLRHLQEPNETRLGYSQDKPQGAGIGSYQSEQLFEALRDSSAARTGFLSSLAECELLIEGIARDKISDLTTNIIRYHLAQYTKDQCELLGIPTHQLPLSPYYSERNNEWLSDYFELPMIYGKPILLVPKAIVRYDTAYDAQQYYNNYVISYLQAENIDANTSLVKTLRSGEKIVYKKDVKATFRLTKENLYRFSRDHPRVLVSYRDYLSELEKRGPESLVTPADETQIAEILTEALRSIPPGSEHAADYHRLMIGIVEFIFFPNLLYPVKEAEIHEGRKRIDIVMENGATEGILFRLHNVRHLPCAFVPFECKNYRTEVANPEIDQLAGRFSSNRGRFGMLCCRNFEDRQTFLARCIDTFRDDRGLIIPIDDNTVIQLLELINNGNRAGIDDILTQIINSVWLQ